MKENNQNIRKRKWWRSNDKVKSSGEIKMQRVGENVRESVTVNVD